MSNYASAEEAAVVLALGDIDREGSAGDARRFMEALATHGHAVVDRDEVERLQSEMRMRELHHFEEEQKRIEAEDEVQRLKCGIEALYRRGIGRTLAPFDPVLLFVGQSRANNAVLDHDMAWRDRVYALLEPYLQEARRLHILRTMADELGINTEDDCGECHAPVGHFTDCSTLTDQEGKS